MKERQILFSTPMIRAILEGRKTQTRRAVRKSNSLTTAPWDELAFDDAVKDGWGLYEGPYLKAAWPTEETRHRVFPRYQRGDILWVKETFKPSQFAGHPVGGYDYKADHVTWLEQHGEAFSNGSGCERGENWKPSIFMPKAACRIWLEITDVRVERLQEISEEDAVAEGVRSCQLTCGWDSTMFEDYMADASGYGDPAVDYPLIDTAVKSFASLWRKINGPQSWKDNPWVWAITFKILSTTGKPSTI